MVGKRGNLQVKIDIRPFQQSDYELYAETLRLTLPCDDIEEAKKNVDIAMNRIKNKNRELWVAEENSTAIGFMLLEFEPKSHNIEIDWFDVHPDHQRIGVGTVLVKKAEERARNLGYKTISLHTAVSNRKMRSFGRKNEFNEESRLPEFWGESTEDAYLLVKKIV